jgi:hypothetical protein
MIFSITLGTIFRVCLLIGFVLIVNALLWQFCFEISPILSRVADERWKETLFWIIMIAIFIGSIWLGIVLIF